MQVLEIISEITKILFFITGSITAIFGILNYSHQIEVTKIKRKSAEIALDILIQEQLNK